MPLVNFSLRVHAVLLAVYPLEFRRKYGWEMEAVFREQMVAASEADGWPETLLVWQYALRDVVAVALPLRLTDSLTMAAVLSAAVTPVVFLSLIWSLENSLAIRFLFRRAFGI